MSLKSRPPSEPPGGPPAAGGPGGARWLRVVLWVLIVGTVGYWLAGGFGGAGPEAERISYTQFRAHVAQGRVQKVTVQGEQIRGTLTEVQGEGEGGGKGPRRFQTFLPSFGDEALLGLLEEHDVELQTRPAQDPAWWSLLIGILPFVVLVGFGWMILRGIRSQGKNVLSVNKSRAKLYDRTTEETTFDDVAGARGAKVELQEIIDYLRRPQRFQRLGGKTPKGVLLNGPPGTGKTLLARAVAGEAEVPFFSITGSDFMEMFVGVGASRVRNMFQEAKKVSPSIIFIDELDSIGRQRGAGLGGGHDEREQTLNQLLSELDGFEPNESVIVMAASNRPDILDPALLRPGRFDRRIAVDLPTLADRVEILQIHTRNKPLAADVQLERLGRATPGFSGADLENVLNEAALLAVRRDRERIEWDDIEEARDKVIMGLTRESMVLTDEECRLLAYHEGGHAVVAALLPRADPVHKVTIVPRGRSMGATQQLPDKDQHLFARDYMLDRLAVMMGGRAAEELVLQTATSGAEDDLKQATRVARKMVLDWGMSERLGYVALGGERQNVFLGEELSRQREYSEQTAREVDEEVRRVLQQAFDRAIQTLKDNIKGLHRVARNLLDREELSGAEVSELLAANGPSRPGSSLEEVVRAKIES